MSSTTAGQLARTLDEESHKIVKEVIESRRWDHTAPPYTGLPNPGDERRRKDAIHELFGPVLDIARVDPILNGVMHVMFSDPSVTPVAAMHALVRAYHNELKQMAHRCERLLNQQTTY